MAQTIKCNGRDCKLKESCYRYTAKNSRNQAFFMMTPYNFKKDECEYYIENITSNYG